jgi:hypothetical protein
MGLNAPGRHDTTGGVGEKGVVRMAQKIDNLFGSSRFVLPEHRELYLQQKVDDKLVPQPRIEQDELDRLITSSGIQLGRTMR